MKKSLAFWMVLLVLVPAFKTLAAPTQHGVYEIRVEPTLDVQDDEANEGIPLHGTFGMYLNPNLQLGAGLTFAKKDVDSYWGKDDVWGLNVYGEVNVDWDYRVVPYLGLSLGLLDGDANNDTVFVTTISPGVKVFFVETLAASLQLNWNFAGDKIYNLDDDPVAIAADDQGGSQSDISLGIGIRFLFY